MRLVRSVGSAIVLIMLAASGSAQEFSAGPVTVEKPWSRATPKAASVAVGYMIVRNHGATPDRLIGGSTDFASRAVEIHQMTMAGGIMRMRQVTAGLEIPQNGEVVFDPNGYHLMFPGLKRPLKQGDTVKVTLVFEHAGALPVEFRVGGLADTGPGGTRPGAPDPMKGMNMN